LLQGRTIAKNWVRFKAQLQMARRRELKKNGVGEKDEDMK